MSGAAETRRRRRVQVATLTENWTTLRASVLYTIDPDLYVVNRVSHNLGPMAKLAGIYDCLWHLDENGIKKAVQLIEPLRKGIDAMKSDPDKFRSLEPANGWGTYADFLPWLGKYLAACEENPDAEIEVSR